jgi:hypothetical protein
MPKTRKDVADDVRHLADLIEDEAAEIASDPLTRCKVTVAINLQWLTGLILDRTRDADGQVVKQRWILEISDVPLRSPG